MPGRDWPGLGAHWGCDLLRKLGSEPARSASRSQPSAWVPLSPGYKTVRSLIHESGALAEPLLATRARSQTGPSILRWRRPLGRARMALWRVATGVPHPLRPAGGFAGRPRAGWPAAPLPKLGGRGKRGQSTSSRHLSWRACEATRPGQERPAQSGEAFRSEGLRGIDASAVGRGQGGARESGAGV